MGFTLGVGEKRLEELDPLAAVFRRSIRTGAPTGSWFYLVARPSKGMIPKVFGTLAVTQAKRLLFFPGRVGTIATVPKDDPLNGYLVDHVTLEMDAAMTGFKEHSSVLKEQRSRGRDRSGPIHDGIMHPWFSLLLPEVSEHIDLPSKFLLEINMPKSDIQRRAHAIMGQPVLINDCWFPAPRSSNPHYFQIDVWAGRGNAWQTRHADVFPWPIMNDVVEGHLGEEVERKAQWKNLEPDIGVAIVLTRPSGTLRVRGLVHANGTSPIKREPVYVAG